eukprot:GHVH01004613.1.p1 GENE.GHVH01004613.1~~GHVH01004613.1.p1  ORF type:complete len:109 (+),score=7.86 GHVH01004613.1:29-328(+)
MTKLAFRSAALTLYVSNLTDGVHRTDLMVLLCEYYSQFGPVSDVRIFGPWSNPKARGQAYISFEDTNTASYAQRTANGENFLGKPMKVAFKAKADDKKG